MERGKQLSGGVVLSAEIEVALFQAKKLRIATSALGLRRDWRNSLVNGFWEGQKRYWTVPNTVSNLPYPNLWKQDTRPQVKIDLELFERPERPQLVSPGQLLDHPGLNWVLASIRRFQKIHIQHVFGKRQGEKRLQPKSRFTQWLTAYVKFQTFVHASAIILSLKAL